MSPARLLMIVAAGTMGLTGAYAADPASPSTLPSAQPQLQRDEDLAAPIRRAQDPSAAIEAYARAQSSSPGNLSAMDAYIRKMVELGMPEMAQSQAERLLERDPNNGFAWALVGYMSIQRGEMPTAAAKIETAVRKSPDDPFVQRIAGQIVAWLDFRGDPARLGDAAVASINNVRQAMAGKSAYTDGYQQTADQYRQMQSQYSDAGYGAGGGYVPPPAPAYPVEPYWEPVSMWYPAYGYFASPWWPGFFSGVVFADFCFGRHHFHGHDHGDFHHDGGFGFHQRGSFGHGDFSRGSLARFNDGRGHSGFGRFDGSSGFHSAGAFDRSRGLTTAGSRFGTAGTSRFGSTALTTHGAPSSFSRGAAMSSFSHTALPPARSMMSARPLSVPSGHYVSGRTLGMRSAPAMGGRMGGSAMQGGGGGHGGSGGRR